MAKAWSQTQGNSSTAWGKCAHDPNWEKRGSCPGGMRRRKMQSLFDPYAPYVLLQWQQGCGDVALLLQDIQAQGYTGQIRTVYRFIQILKQVVESLPPLSVLDRVSVQEALRLMVRPQASHYFVNESCTSYSPALFIQIDQDKQSLSSFITALPPSFMSDFPTVSIPLGKRIHKSNCVIEECGEKGKREMAVP